MPENAKTCIMNVRTQTSMVLTQVALLFIIYSVVRSVERQTSRKFDQLLHALDGLHTLDTQDRSCLH